MKYYLTDSLANKAQDLRQLTREQRQQADAIDMALRYLLSIDPPYAGAVEETLKAAEALLEQLARQYGDLANEISHYRLYGDKEETE